MANKIKLVSDKLIYYMSLIGVSGGSIFCIFFLFLMASAFIEGIKNNDIKAYLALVLFLTFFFIPSLFILIKLKFIYRDENGFIVGKEHIPWDSIQSFHFQRLFVPRLLFIKYKDQGISRSVLTTIPESRIDKLREIIKINKCT